MIFGLVFVAESFLEGILPAACVFESGFGGLRRFVNDRSTMLPDPVGTLASFFADFLSFFANLLSSFACEFSGFVGVLTSFLADSFAGFGYSLGGCFAAGEFPSQTLRAAPDGAAKEDQNKHEDYAANARNRKRCSFVSEFRLVVFTKVSQFGLLIVGFRFHRE